ncbi:hypothetical protein Dda3937_04553 [Dickeya dadantii 3937]|uniref:Uncharacterized protein n=1 Tax=Dickeya dadantii (strain 3937) TaxID=198628 RepID=E0SM14_DICD3|nr:hypothetical protein Dda3937_04553 [Dickeya dadantii 3937]
MNRDIGTVQSRHHAFIASRHGSPIGKPSNLTAHDSERGAPRRRRSSQLCRPSAQTLNVRRKQRAESRFRRCASRLKCDRNRILTCDWLQ